MWWTAGYPSAFNCTLNTHYCIVSYRIVSYRIVLNSFRIWFVKMAWPSTQQNQSPFCLAHQKGSNLFPVWNPVTSLVQTSQLSDKVKILGATLDSNLTMEPHTKALSSFCFYHIRSFKQIRSSLDEGMAVSVASALVSSCLDQVNFILYGAASKHINRLQRV